MTELLYMQDFDVEACHGSIESINTIEDSHIDIVLDKTCFYARGGGQDWDKGEISGENATFRVEEVRLDEQGTVHHIGHMINGLFATGDIIAGHVDHERRRVNTRLHSAGHVIDMAIASLGLDWVGTKGQHYPHLSAVEYKGTWEPERVEWLKQSIEKQTNAFIAKGIKNSLKFIPVKEMYAVCRYVPENIPKNKPGRVVMYGDNFAIPCGGTHVKNLRQVGSVRVLKLKEKKGVIRLTYVVEGIATN